MLERKPIYHQLYDRLKILVNGRRYSSGDKFLTERQIADLYQVSRATANKVLSGMVAEGILEFRKGIGTFVQSPRLSVDVRHLVSFAEKAKRAGKKPSTNVRRFEVRRASEIDAFHRENLKVTARQKIFCIERVRSVDDVPMILDRRFVPYAGCCQMTRTDAGNSLYSYWVDQIGLRVSGADETIRSVNAKGEEAELLAIKPGEACLQVVSVGQLDNGKPIWSAVILYRGDMYEFHSKTNPLGPVLPTVGNLK